MRKIISALQFSLLCILLVVIAFSYHPVVVNASNLAGFESGTVLSKYIMVLYVALFICSLFRRPIHIERLLVVYGFWFLLIIVIGLFAYALYSNSSILSSCRMFFIVFAALLIGSTLNPTSRQICIILFVFSTAILFCGLAQVFTNLGGFVIADQYLIDSKNSLGAMLASAEIALFYLWAGQKEKRLKLIAIILLLLCFIVILTIRARGALLATLIVGLLVFVKYREVSVTWVIIIVPIVLVSLSFLPTSFHDYFYQSIHAGTQAEDITSGRMKAYNLAFDFFAQQPLMGNIKNYAHLPWIHNFPLLNLCQYGILFSWPILCLYLYLLVFSIKHFVKTALDCNNVGYAIILIPYIVSMVEPTFPFGPGTVTVFNFVLLGASEYLRLK